MVKIFPLLLLYRNDHPTSLILHYYFEDKKTFKLIQNNQTNVFSANVIAIITSQTSRKPRTWLKRVLFLISDGEEQTKEIWQI